MKLLAAKKIFFNYATVGFLEPYSYRAILKFLAEYVKVGPPEVLEKYDNYSRKLSEEVSKLLNCDADEIVPVKNTTEGIIIASEALPLNRGDEVLLVGNEYPGNFLPWLKKRQDGILVTVINDTNNNQAYKSLLAAINPRTKVIAMSWGQYYDGYLPDLTRLSKICKKHKIFLVIDGVHGVGTKVLDLKKTHVDMLSCGGQKHLGAIVGIGFLYVNKKIISRLKATKIGIRSVQGFDEHKYKLKNSAQRFGDGTQNLLGIVSLWAAVKHMNALGMKNVEKKNALLLKKFKACLRKNHIPFIDHKSQASVIALKISDPKGLYEYLRQNHIYIKTVKDVARISFCHKSNFEDFQKLVAKTKQWLATQNL